MTLDTVSDHDLIRKLDWNIIPLVMALYLFSFLDRVNIGNARLYGLEEDLGLSPRQWQVAVSSLFVTYVLFEIPSNLVIKKFRPRRYIAGIAIGWGTVASLTGMVQNFRGLVAARLALGMFEAGLFPGLAVYLTFFYTKKEFALRIGFLFVSAALAGACGGFLAYCIGFMDGIARLRGWRWILIIEGLPSIFLGILTYFFLADDPASAKFLTPAEKLHMEGRMLKEMGLTKRDMEFHWKDVRNCFQDWRVWAFAFAQVGPATGLYGFSTFLPTIIKAIGSTPTHNVWTTPQVQALTIPCYCLGALVYLLSAYLSDKYQRRALPTIIACSVSLTGYTILLTAASQGAKYFGCFVVAAGLYTFIGLPLSWLPANCPRYGKRTTAGGLQLTIGNFSGIMISFIYPAADSPRYTRGHAGTLGVIAFAGTVYSVLWYSYARTNRLRDAKMGVGEPKEAKDKTESCMENQNEMGDKAPSFRYAT